jgi:hypothetical protein
LAKAVIASEAKQSIARQAERWIASSLSLLAMTGMDMGSHSHGAVFRLSFANSLSLSWKEGAGKAGR